MEQFLFYGKTLFLNDYTLMWISNTRLISNRKWKFCFLKMEKPHLLFSSKYLFKTGIRNQPFPTKRSCFHWICIFDWKPCFKVLKLDHCEAAFVSNWPQGSRKLCGWDSSHLLIGVQSKLFVNGQWHLQRAILSILVIKAPREEFALDTHFFSG